MHERTHAPMHSYTCALTLTHSHTHARTNKRFLDGVYKCGNDEMYNVSISYADYFKHWYRNFIFERAHEKSNKMACTPSEDSDQPRNPPSLITVFAVRMKKSLCLKHTLSAQRRVWSDWAGFVMHWLIFHFILHVPMFNFSLHRCNKYNPPV